MLHCRGPLYVTPEYKSRRSRYLWDELPWLKDTQCKIQIEICTPINDHNKLNLPLHSTRPCKLRHPWKRDIIKYLTSSRNVNITFFSDETRYPSPPQVIITTSQRLYSNNCSTELNSTMKRLYLIQCLCMNVKSVMSYYPLFFFCMKEKTPLCSNHVQRSTHTI